MRIQLARHRSALIVVFLAVVVLLTANKFIKPRVHGNLQSSAGDATQYQGTFKHYVSPSLGIAFDYASGPADQRVLAKEVGDKIYLYINYTHKDDPTSGKFVEVFSKDPSESLSDAVKSQFLQGYSPESCRVMSANLSKTTINPAREYVQIAIPEKTYSTMADRLAAEKACPATYTYNGRTGLSYFMMDPAHPNEFVFFSLGQDNFYGTAPDNQGYGLSWDRTLQFTK